MPLNNSQYDSIMRTYDYTRAANRLIKEKRYAEITSICPEYVEVEDQIITLSMQTAINRAKDNNSSNTSFDEFKKSLARLEAHKKELLLSLGKPADYLDDIYTCPICKDSGYVDNNRCTCFTKKAIDLVYSDSNLKNITSNQNFGTFSYEWYDNEHTDSATGLTPYNNMQLIVKKCHQFIDNFDTTFSNMLFYGNTGVGKTFLVNCIAKELLDSSHSVIYLTAIELFERLEKRDFNRDYKRDIDFDDSIGDYLYESDLLIIDDLGTETSNSYTNSRLFHIINERILRRKSVIISTNLTGGELRDRYSERVSSRIASSYNIFKMYGDDIRFLMRTKQ